MSIRNGILTEKEERHLEMSGGILWADLHARFPETAYSD